MKLLDFGVAKLAGQTVLTRTGTTLGTVAYMAPEQVTGRGADERSDVWALGVVLYEMLARQLPFRGDHELAMLQAITTESPVPLSSVRADVPAALEAVVARALQKDPARRYASSRELLADLEALRTPTGATAVSAGTRCAASGTSSAAPGTSPTTSLARWMRDPRSSAWLATGSARCASPIHRRCPRRRPRRSAA